MNDWSFNMEEAPRGRYEQDTLPGRGGSVRTVTRFIPDRVIVASKCGKVMSSYWLPPNEEEKRPVGRWNGFNADSPPIAWQPWPKHPQGDKE